MSTKHRLNFDEDDLSNNWSVEILPENDINLQLHQSKRKRTYDNLFHAVKEYFKPFQLCKHLPSGSDANMNALVIATRGYLGRVIIPCGSYVSGDSGVLQGYSSSTFSNINGYTNISSPSSNIPQEGKDVTTPFPYHIPNAIDNDIDKVVLDDLEAHCLQEIRYKIYVKILNKQAIRCVLIEPILACNGATLSFAFLEKFGNYVSNLTLLLSWMKYLLQGELVTCCCGKDYHPSSRIKWHILLWENGWNQDWFYRI